MITPDSGAFRWLSPLGVSASLFLGFSLICLIFGTLAQFLVRRYGPGSPSATLMDWFVFSPRVDSAYFGKMPAELVKETPAIAELRVTLLNLFGGFVICLTIAQVCLVWFGLRAGHPWRCGPWLSATWPWSFNTGSGWCRRLRGRSHWASRIFNLTCCIP